MSKIVITVDDVANRADFVSCVRRITEMHVSEIVSRIGAGVPLAEFVLFENNHADVAQQLLEFIQLENTATIRIYELMQNEQFSKCPLDECEISPSILKNILDSHEARREFDT